jgi:opacity protein-like surface antigen
MNDLGKFNFAWDVGAGFEFMAYGPARLFAEYHFHNDIKATYKNNNVKVRSLTHELRVGLMFRFNKRGNNCNAPTYVE